MGRRKGGGVKGLLVLALVVGVIWFFSEYPYLSVTLIVIALVVAALGQGSSNCEVCDATLKRKSHRWELDGVSKTVCPNCNSNLSRKKSSQSIRELGL